MPNRNYVNGRAREYRIMRKLESEGYTCFRMAGSHTKVDIIAVRGVPYLGRIGFEKFRFIQSKTTGYLSPKERMEKMELERKLGIVIEVL